MGSDMNLGRGTSKFGLLLGALMILSSSLSFGQATGSILGSVTDATSARMPGVSVTAVNPASGAQRTAITNETGAYNFSSLLPGDYEVTAEISGFKTILKRMKRFTSSTVRKCATKPFSSRKPRSR